MNLEPLFAHELSPRKIDPTRYPDVKAWVIKAIAEEDQQANSILWESEPAEDDQQTERLRRIKFLRKYEKDNPLVKTIAERLAACGKGNRCCSGACSECGWLLQRWLVRKSKPFISDVINKDDQQLVAITIIPSEPSVTPGELINFSMVDLERRLKYALDKAGLGAAIGGIDISFNEDQDGKYNPFWCVHPYVITSVKNKKRVKRELRKIFESDDRIKRPIKVSDFENSARRRSYVLKTVFWLRIGYDEVKAEGRRCRNTSRDKLRATERLELFTYLDRCGLAGRLIFRGTKPVIRSSGVTIEETGLALSYQGKSKKQQKITKNHSKIGSLGHLQ